MDYMEFTKEMNALYNSVGDNAEFIKFLKSWETYYEDSLYGVE